MTGDGPVELRRVTPGSSRRPLAVGVVLAGAVVAAVVVGRLAPGPPVVVTPSPLVVAIGTPALSAAASPTPPTTATPVPLPTRPAPYRTVSTEGAVSYVNPDLGLSIPLAGDDEPGGSWDETGRVDSAGGAITVPVPGDFGAPSGVIGISVGSRGNPAPVRIPADGGTVHPLWTPTLVDLVQQYALLLDGRFGTPSRLLLDGEPAFRFERPASATAVVVAVHLGRVYVIAAWNPGPGRGPSLTALAIVLARFRFLPIAGPPDQ